jgi:hypothetical protein
MDGSRMDPAHKARAAAIKRAKRDGAGWGGGRVVDPDTHGCAKMSAEDIAGYFKRWKAGARAEELAAEAGVSVGTMRKHLTRLNKRKGGL